MRPRLLALALLLPTACGDGEPRPAAPARPEELVSTQKRKSPRLRVGPATCPDQVRLADGTRFTCTA